MTVSSTIDDSEVARFSAMAKEWWDPNGKFRPLHRYNPVRIGYLRDALCQRFARDANASRPLAGLRLVDIGCGGGLLCEPLAQLGAQVVGIDASQRNIKTAAQHASEGGLDIDYRVSSAEALVETGERFDAAIALEVVEHVADVPLFLQSCVGLVRSGGLLFLATMNRTPKAWLMAIVGAEYVMGWLPRGTHDWKKFQKPSEISNILRQHNTSVCHITGVVYHPISGTFTLDSQDMDVNYILFAQVS